MNALRGLACLLLLQSLGELLSRGLRLPFPGPVVGMVLLLLALRWPRVRAPVAACAEYLLSHLSLLFVPVGVGVMTHLSIVSQYGGRMLVVLVLSTLCGLAVTALLLHRLWPGTPGAPADVAANRATPDAPSPANAASPTNPSSPVSPASPHA